MDTNRPQAKELKTKAIAYHKSPESQNWTHPKSDIQSQMLQVNNIQNSKSLQMHPTMPSEQERKRNPLSGFNYGYLFWPFPLQPHIPPFKRFQGRPLNYENKHEIRL